MSRRGKHSKSKKSAPPRTPAQVGRNKKSQRSPRAASVPPPSSREAEVIAVEALGSRPAAFEAELGEAMSGEAMSVESEPTSEPVESAPSSEPLESNAVEVLPLEAEVEPPGSAPPSESVEARASREDVSDRIRELEARLDRMIDEAARRGHGDFAPRDRPSTPLSTRALPDDAEATVFDTARELLSTDFYLRKWGRLGMRNRSEEVDDFGFDPVYEQKVLPVFALLYEKYFRVQVEGAANIPAEGRCLLVANHSGTLPFDGMMLKLAVKREHAQRRDVRWLAEDLIFHFPFLGSFSNRVGAVRACQENAERLLDQDALVAVFPEGMKGIGKLFKERYRLQRFGRGGFVKLCLRTQTPIVPVAIVGGEETNPMLFRIEYLTKALGLPYFPITPTFPWLGPVGLLPAPTKWTIRFGDPVAFDGYGPEAAEDEILVGRLSERIRATIQAMLDRALGERRSVWFG
jgi:1-acyl-sn-glycerol-3-phosphate acyltransferase